ncbi:MAG: DUF374 domain-containing protein [Gammaproteobacteria bacterium]|nr:DUF374 domain-containing protein [Gammaproteobacteria bacterium]
MEPAQEIRQDAARARGATETAAGGRPTRRIRSLRTRFTGGLLAWSLRLQRHTWRVRVEGKEALDALLARKQRAIICFWHGKYAPIFALLEGYRGCAFSSRSPRGDIIAEICRRFGYDCTQIADDGGDESLQIVKSAIAGYSLAGIAVDGPRGPYHLVKRGTIQLASDLGYWLVPVSVDARRKRLLRQRWDRLEFPRPFTTVALQIGAAIAVAPNLPAEMIEAQATALHDALIETDRRAAAAIESA